MSESKGKGAKFLRGVLFAAAVLPALLLIFGFASFASWMAPEHSTTVTVDIPGTENQLLLDEYAEFRSGYFDIYLRVPGKRDRLLARGDFNEPHCPIINGNYEIQFDADTATIYYPFSITSARADWSELTVELEP